MPEWLKILCLIVGMGVWLATAVLSFMKGELPDAATLGIPAVLFAALFPPITITRRRGNRDESTEEEAEASS